MKDGGATSPRPKNTRPPMIIGNPALFATFAAFEGGTTGFAVSGSALTACPPNDGFRAADTAIGGGGQVISPSFTTVAPRTTVVNEGEITWPHKHGEMGHERWRCDKPET